MLVRAPKPCRVPRVRRRAAIAAGALAWLLVSGLAPARATTYVMTTDDELLAKATLVVAGTVRGVEPVEATFGARGGALPATDYTIEVERLLHGRLSSGTLVMRLPGGTRADGSTWRLWGTPTFVPGERLVLFLGLAENDVHPLVELGLGAFRETRSGNARLLLRDLRGSHEVALAADPRAAERRASHRPRDRARFLEWLADRSAGERRAPDYFVDVVAPLPPRDLAAYTLVRPCTDEQTFVRWHEFDRGEPVRIRVDSAGQIGVPGGGFEEVQEAIALWNRDDRSSVELRYGGEGAPPAALDNRENWVYFEDPFDMLPGVFNISGVLAVATGDGSCDEIPFGNGEAGSIFEADIVTQDGTGATYFGLREPADFVEVIGHELGHVLGLGHACGDALSPACSGAVASALMAAFAHGDGRGARLSNDDRQAIRFLYPAETSEPAAPAAPSELLATTRDDGTVTLTWADNSDDETTFEVQERSAFVAFAPRAILPPDSTELTLTDVPPGVFRSYRVRAVNSQGASEYSAEAGVTTFATAGPCVPDETTLCLEGEFRARVAFVEGFLERQALANELTANTGFFTFFDAANVEIVLKVLDGCTINQRQWVFVAGLTDVPVAITVSHMPSGETRTYLNPGGQAFAPVQDTDAFARCQ